MSKRKNKSSQQKSNESNYEAVHASNLSEEELESSEALEAQEIEIDGESSNDLESDLAERLKNIDGVNEDAAEFMAENWSRFLGLLVLGVLGLFAYNGVKNVASKKSFKASDRFIQVQDRLQKFAQVDLEGKDKDSELVKEAEKNEKALFDSLDVLKSSFSDTIYGQVAPLYEARALLEKGEADKARGILNKFSTQASTGQGDISSQLLVKEFASLLSAKSYLMGKTPDLNTSKQKLKELAQSSELLSGEALVSLMNLSDTPAEKEEVLKLSKEVVKSKPRFRKQLEQAYLLHGLKFEEGE